MTKVRHSVSQSNQFNGRGLGKKLFQTPNKRLAKNNPIYRQSIKIMMKKDGI